MHTELCGVMPRRKQEPSEERTSLMEPMSINDHHSGEPHSGTADRIIREANETASFPALAGPIASARRFAGGNRAIDGYVCRPNEPQSTKQLSDSRSHIRQANLSIVH